jgi:hypothetical protein
VAPARGRTLKSLGSSLLIGLPFVNFARVETQFPDYPSFLRFGPYRVASALASITADLRAAAS